MQPKDEGVFRYSSSEPVLFVLPPLPTTAKVQILYFPMLL